MLAGAAVARLDGAARLILRDGELRAMPSRTPWCEPGRPAGLRDPDRFDAWLRRLTVNACLDVARRRQRRSIEVELTPILMPSVDDESAGFAERDSSMSRFAGSTRSGARSWSSTSFSGCPDGDRRRDGDPGRDGQVPSPSVARGDAQHACRRPGGDRAGPRRAVRMSSSERRAQAAGAPRGARGTADARLLRRHPRPGRPHAAATGLDLPRKVAPMSAVSDRLATAPRFPIRAVIAAALVLLALVGSRPVRRRPEDGGPAAVRARGKRGHRLHRPGRSDPIRPDRRQGVQGHRPRTGQRATGLLPDGTKLAYLHNSNIVVAAPDGSGGRTVNADGLVSAAYLGWTPDSASVVIASPAGRILAYDSVKPGPPTLITDKARVSGAVSGLNGFHSRLTSLFRPPLGEELAFIGSGSEATASMSHNVTARGCGRCSPPALAAYPLSTWRTPSGLPTAAGSPSWRGHRRP